VDDRQHDTATADGEISQTQLGHDLFTSWIEAPREPAVIQVITAHVLSRCGRVRKER
jgi:hypothetical protein